MLPEVNRPSRDPPAPNRLRAVLGFGFGLAIVIGTVVPVSFANSSLTARHLPSLLPWIAAWVVGGLYALLGANAQAELATMLPRAGGPYVYAKAAYGPWGGFLVGWADTLINTCGLAAPLLLVGGFLGELWPPVTRFSTAIAVAGVVLVAAVNHAGIGAGDRVQKVSAAGWGVVLLAFALLAIVAPAPASAPAPAGAAPGAAPAWLPGAAAFAAAQRLILFSYSGWNAPVYLAEEHVDPGRQLPRAMFVGIGLTVVIYVVVNAALAHVLTMQGLGAAPLPLVAALRATGGPLAVGAVVVLSAVSMLGGLNAGLLFTSRTLYALARDGFVTRGATTVNAGGTPALALWLVALAAIGFLVSGTYDELLAVFAGVAVANDLLMAGAVVVLRRRAPSLPRPWRARGYPWTLLVLGAADAVLAASLARESPAQTACALALLVASVPVYLALRRRRVGARLGPSGR
ncbi:APC family permease [Anaeromyxobacter paludicola]|uniref:Amino acid permease n=1 Tax=Anaeromyxobacter paludicola TaxID=2918171 RepID=A0ABM7X9N7_9BACT|nr:APC family permease [Anaeromyxobacter paludicola]BDG08555.1 amino acid permease [Anaeromyxobacter paludicola]